LRFANERPHFGHFQSGLPMREQFTIETQVIARRHLLTVPLRFTRV